MASSFFYQKYGDCIYDEARDVKPGYLTVNPVWRDIKKPPDRYEAALMLFIST